MYLLALLMSALPCAIAVTSGVVTEISSFAVPKSPSGMFYYPTEDILYILCGTNTNGENYL